MFCVIQIRIIFASAFSDGTLAQLVEQRTENPCVPGSIPGGTTTSVKPTPIGVGFFMLARVERSRS